MDEFILTTELHSEQRIVFDLEENKKVFCFEVYLCSDITPEMIEYSFA